ncbi:MAG: hypothetical protein LBO63_08760 [Oscillospiraceae bacterium]|jgi:hypothetical protein|nr:hypothetical protein [Oscillospiraceae bacterium]
MASNDGVFSIIEELVRLLEDSRKSNREKIKDVSVLGSVTALQRGDYRLVNIAEALTLLDRLKMELPPALEDAERIKAGKREYLEKAHREAADLISNAKLQRQQLVDETTVMEEAKRKARLIEVTSQKQASELLKKSTDYILTLMGDAETVLVASVAKLNGTQVKYKKKLEAMKEAEELNSTTPMDD